MSPEVIVDSRDSLATMRPPSTAMPTYDRFPMNIMPGMIMPERNCALKLAR